VKLFGGVNWADLNKFLFSERLVEIHDTPTSRSVANAEKKTINKDRLIFTNFIENFFTQIFEFDYKMSLYFLYK
jgi:hypothetical protein